MKTNFSVTCCCFFLSKRGGTIKVAHANPWQNPSVDDCNEKRVFQTTAYSH